MNAPTFFRQIRKTSIFFLVLFLVFLIHRIVHLFVENSADSVSTLLLQTPRQAESVICHNIVGGAAFGIDSLFEEYTRVYFYSQLLVDSVPSVEHRWFCGKDTMLIVPCSCNGNVCTSSIAPERLKAGEWSVDLVFEKKILDSRQFLVTAPDL